MNDYFDEFFSPPEPRISFTRGGPRPNSGRKPGHKSATAEVPTEQLTEYQRLERAKADKEEQLARQAKTKADLDEGATVMRESVQIATATAYAVIAQSLQAIPDNLERQLGITPDVAEKVREMIDEALGELSNDLKQIHENSHDGN